MSDRELFEKGAAGHRAERAGIDNENDQVSKGHSVDALALRGYEGRTTLR